MKKSLSILLLLALLLSLNGCGAEVPPLTVPQTEPIVTEATLPPETEPAEQITIPNLLGQQVQKLTESEEYQVEISQTITSATQAEGTILGQAPVGGTQADKGSTIYVIVTTGGPEDPLPTQPEETEPVITRPQYTPPTEPDLPEQTDPVWDYPPEPEIEETEPPTEPESTEPQPYLDPNGTYTSKDDVALFIYLYKRLPNNFVTKNQAEDLYGWSGGSLSKYGMCIGGDRFYNNEGRLPSGYTYYECDIDTLYSSKRGAKRLVFTYSGIVYYTSDHYKTFTRLY